MKNKLKDFLFCIKPDVISSFKKRKRSKDGLCEGLKILRYWFDTSRFHECSSTLLACRDCGKDRVLGSIPRGRNATGATEAFFKITYNVKITTVDYREDGDKIVISRHFPKSSILYIDYRYFED